MKKTRKIAAFAAAMAMAATMAMPMASFADSTGATTTVTVNAPATHTFTAYQILTGTWEVPAGSTGSKVLKGATVGSGVDAAKLKTALSLGTDATGVQIADALATKTSAQIVAIMETDNMLTSTSTTLATGTELANGYYYVVETDSNDATVSASILCCAEGAEGVTIAPKMGAPRVEKKIQEDDREITATGETIGSDTPESKWNDAADYCIGEAVPFKIYGTMPANIGMYTHYFYQFKDELAKGFVKPTAVTVKIDGADAEGYEVDMTDAADGGTNITITFDDIKDGNTITADSIVTVEYSAVLDTDAVIGAKGNTNGVKLVYSNNTSYDGSGITTEDEHGPNGEGGPDGTPDNNQDETPGNDTGETNKDGVVAFTYTLDSTKVDSVSKAALPGAKFKLLNSDKSMAAVIENGIVTDWAAAATGGTEITTDDDGKFTIKGLDSEDTYYIKEIEAPAGYNMLTEEVAVTITMTGMNANGTYNYVKDDGTLAYGNLNSSTFGGTAVTESPAGSGVVAGNIENAKGPTLPSTGGMGTTLFVLGGGCMAGLAGIYLISKKRSKDAE